MKVTTRRKNRQPTLQEDSGSSNGGKTTPVPVGQPDEWRLEAAIVALLTLTDGDNRLICPPFRVLPTPAEFPLYYEHIKNPIDLKSIAGRVRAGHYADWAALETDIQLLCQNAKDFNESGPMLRKDADLLFNQFKSRAIELAGARRFSARVLTRNKEYIDELLRSTASEADEYSEDSEEDEDSERSDDPLWCLYWTIRNFDVVDGVPLCENFMELPSKRSYPDYYEEIERPMSLYMINKKLKRGQYAQQQHNHHQLHGLVQDLLLMFDNACSYNIEESDIYEAAQRLRKLTLQTVKKLDGTFRTMAQQHKAIKQEMVDDDDTVADAGKEDKLQSQQRQNHSHASPPPPFLPKMNGTSAVVPPVKRRKVAQKGDGAGDDDATTSAAPPQQQPQPMRRPVKREASAKGEQAIKRMVDSDFDDDDDDYDEQRPTAVHHQNNKSLTNNDATSVPSASTTSLPQIGAATTPFASSPKQHQRAPRRLNADGTPAERLKPGRKSVDELREKFAQKLTAVWQDVQSLKMGNRALAEPFSYLPCGKTFPDYYRTITKPISLTCIQRKIKEQRYADSDELLADLRLMFDNARAYNKPDAQICADVTILESVAVGSMRTHTEGVTLFYPYRRTDKGWSEKASIEKSPLKMKRKGVSNTPTTVTSTPSGPPSTIVHVHQQQQQQQQQIVVVQQQHQQQQQLPSASAAKQQQHQQYFTSTAANSALMNGVPPNATVQQVLHSGAIAGYASSSCSTTTVGSAVVSHLQHSQHQQQVQAVQQQHFQPHSTTDVQSPPLLPSTTVGVATLPSSSSSSSIQQHHQLPGLNSSNAVAGTTPIASTAAMVQQQQHQVIIDPGRTVVNATPKTIEPVFVEPSTSAKVQRVLHSEAYVRYIESMYSNKVQRTVSTWDKNLQTTHPQNAATASASSPVGTASVFFDVITNSKNNANSRRQLAQQWIRLSSNGSKNREKDLVQALWTLRDHLIEGTIGVARHAELPADEPPPPLRAMTTATTVPSSSSKSGFNISNNNNNSIYKAGASAEKQRNG